MATLLNKSGLNKSGRSVAIEKATPGMAELLAALHAAAFHRPGDETWTASSFAKVIATPGAFCLIASIDSENGQEPCGFAACRFGRAEGELLSIGVVPPRQRENIARDLIERCIEHCRKIGAQDLYLEVAKDNPNAQGLYDNLGFSVIGHRSGYYKRLAGRRVDAITMRLEIS